MFMFSNVEVKAGREKAEHALHNSAISIFAWDKRTCIAMCTTIAYIFTN